MMMRMRLRRRVTGSRSSLATSSALILAASGPLAIVAVLLFGSRTASPPSPAAVLGSSLTKSGVKVLEGMAGGRPAILWIRGSDGNGDAAQVGGLQGQGDFIAGAFGQGKQRRPDGGVLQDAAGNEAFLEGDGAFHVRPAVIDVLGHRQEAVVDGAGRGVVLGLAGGDELHQRFGGESA